MIRILCCLCMAVVLTSFHADAQVLNSSNLPIIKINTNGLTIYPDVKIAADMGIVFNGDGVRNNVTDPSNHYNGKIGIEVRGQSSQGFPMKSYNVELRENTGEERNASLFGMPEESDWVLYAPYTDKSLMHNFLAYTLSNEMGHWASHCRYVELVVNGDYKGIYVLMEKIKRSEGRLGLAKLNPVDIDGDQLTGGYIFSLDKQPNGWFSAFPVPNASNSNTRQYSYVYPKVDEIMPQQKAYIKSAVDRFESTLNSSQFQDPVNGVRKYIDHRSFVDYHIINEISRNVDGYRLSSYFHKDKDSKNPLIFAGPVWDYDIAFHNADYCNGSLTSGWALDFNYVCPGDAAGSIPFFWYKLVRQDTFYQNMLYCRWNQFRGNILSEAHLDHLIDSISNLTAEARSRHFTRWPILGIYVWPNPQPIPADYDGEIAQLKSWLHDRLNWLDRNFPQTGTCWPEEVASSVIIDIYPNPLQNHSVIKIKSRAIQQMDMSVYNSFGKLVRKQLINLTTGDNLFNNLNFESLNHGVYHFRFTNKAGEKIVKTVIK